MFLEPPSLVMVILLFLGLAVRIGGQQQPDCTNQQILQNDLSGGCVCSGGKDKCNVQCSVGPDVPNCPNGLLSQLTLDHCSLHCATESNHHCTGCWIWFEPLCKCLQSGGCPQSNPKPPFWVKVNSELATTNLPISDILDLQQNHQFLAKFGWDFGQQNGVSNPGTEALVINSVHSITEDQIHMHICPLNTGMKHFLGNLYQGIPAAYSNLAEVQITGYKMFCRASQTAGQPIPGDTISADINSVIQQQQCKYFVGAAVIRDSNDFTWSCVTADHFSTEYGRFCA